MSLSKEFEMMEASRQVDRVVHGEPKPFLSGEQAQGAGLTKAAQQDQRHGDRCKQQGENGKPVVGHG